MSNHASSFSIEEPKKGNGEERSQNPQLAKCALFSSAIIMFIAMVIQIVGGMSLKSKYKFLSYREIFKENDYYNVTECRGVGSIRWQNHSIQMVSQNRSAWKIEFQCEKNFTKMLLEEYWRPRLHAQPLILGTSFLHFFAVLLMLPAIYFIIRLYRRNKLTNLSDITLTSFHIAITMLLLEITIHLGQSTFLNWFTIVELYALPFEGISFTSTLYLISKALDGAFMWLFTVNDVLFTLGICCIGVMTLYGQEAVFSNKHAYLGITMSGLAILSFLFGFCRFFSWRLFDGLNHLMNFVSMGILLPVWLIWTGFSLRSTSAEQYDSLLRGA